VIAALGGLPAKSGIDEGKSPSAIEFSALGGRLDEGETPSAT